MSACNVLLQPQRKAVHMMVDAAGYDTDGVILTLSQKCFALPTLPAAVSATGVGIAGELLAREIGRQFDTFDELIHGLEDFGREFYDVYAETISTFPLTDINMTVIGWSVSRRGPEAYSMAMTEPDQDAYIKERTEKQKAEFGANAIIQNEPFKRVELDTCTINPPPFKPFDQIAFEIKPGAEGFELMDPERDLLHILEAQRRRKFATRPGWPEAHKVGGFALLTSVTQDEVTQKIVHRWSEDRVGELISPVPIPDWAAWRQARRAPPPDNLSRLQRERWVKKQSKGKLQVVK